MNLVLSDAASPTLVIVGVAALLFVVFMFVAIWAGRYMKVGPDEVLVVAGRRYAVIDSEGKTHEVGFRMVRGGGAFIWPVYEKAAILSLKPVSLDLTLPGISTRDGYNAEISAKGQVKIKSDDASLLKAAESLLGKTPVEVMDVANQLMESLLRLLVGEWTAAEMFQRRGQLAGLWQEAAKPALNGLGLELLSLSVRDIKAS
jgi:flotillin